MRISIRPQLSIVHPRINHPHAAELQAISDIIDAKPETVALVLEDIVPDGVDVALGRMGMTGEQVLRALIVKQMNDYSYEQLAFHLADSATYRAFCRFGFDRQPPKKSPLQKNIKRVKPETWEAINRALLRLAQQLGLEDGRKVRTDSTVVESNILYPNDSTLLWDSVRVLARLMRRARQEFGIGFVDHTRRAKRRMLNITHARSRQVRKSLYRDLVKVTKKTAREAESTITALAEVEPGSITQMAQVEALTTELRHYVDLARRVISQTERRVFDDEKVPASEKLVSIFEEHTDVIIKDNRQTLYGHKVFLTTGASGLVTDVLVERGNPADSKRAVKMVQRQRDLYGRVPRQACFDAGFASQATLADIKALRVEDVAFHKRSRLEVSDMVKSSWVYRQLCAFRAGIEGVISFLKRGFGLGRCLWRGFQSFQAYVHASVLACNLLTAARHGLAAKVG